MDSKILREYITQEGNRHEVVSRPPVAVTNAVSWRTEGIKHRKNEIFLDVVEKLNLLVSSNGTVSERRVLPNRFRLPVDEFVGFLLFRRVHQFHKMGAEQAMGKIDG
jgi:hypothetical protein